MNPVSFSLSCVCMCVCVCVRAVHSNSTCVQQRVDVFQQGWISSVASLHWRLVHRKPRLAWAHFSALPPVQGFNKAWRRVEGSGGGGGGRWWIIPAGCWFGISLARRCRVTHARRLAQSYGAKSCLNPKWVPGRKVWFMAVWPWKYHRPLFHCLHILCWFCFSAFCYIFFSYFSFLLFNNSWNFVISLILLEK